MSGLLIHLIHGVTLLLSPTRGWREIMEEPYELPPLVFYTVMLSTWAIFWRGLGRLLGPDSVGAALLDGVLYALMQLIIVLGVVVLVRGGRRLARRTLEEGDAGRLALYASTPMWLLSIFQAIPDERARGLALLISLGYGCTLFFRGVPLILNSEPVHTLALSIVVSVFWVVASTSMVQVVLDVFVFL